MPDLRRAMIANRGFLGLAVRHAVSRGVRQFVDIGSGLPTAGNVHEVADRQAPGQCRVVYVDNEPVTHAHADLLLAGTADTRRHRAVRADYLEHDTVGCSHGCDELDDPGIQQVVRNYAQTATAAHLRSRAEIAAFFGDFEFVPPGLVWTPEWGEAIQDQWLGLPARSRYLAAVARKPG